MEEIMIVDYI